MLVVLACSRAYHGCCAPLFDLWSPRGLLPSALACSVSLHAHVSFMIKNLTCLYVSVPGVLVCVICFTFQK